MVQVPYRHYTFDGLDLNEKDITSFRTLVDSTLDSVERSLQVAANMVSMTIVDDDNCKFVVIILF